VARAVAADAHAVRRGGGGHRRWLERDVVVRGARLRLGRIVDRVAAALGCGEELDVPDDLVAGPLGAVGGLPLGVFQAPADGHKPAPREDLGRGLGGLAERGHVDVGGGGWY
jgi:hypothetical protein